jgi:hypothetical protein
MGTNSFFTVPNLFVSRAKNCRQKILNGEFWIKNRKIVNYKGYFLEMCFEKGSVCILKSLGRQKMPVGTKFGSAALTF